jgi:hypothetical protein
MPGAYPSSGHDSRRRGNVLEKKKPVKKLVHKFQAKFKSTIHREGRESIRGRN